jgi:hypothetical protein
MDIKVVVKTAHAEISFEGSEEIFDGKISPILQRLLDRALSADARAEPTKPSNPDRDRDWPQGTILQMTIKTVATRLGVTSGADLLIAAAASLSIVKGSETFTRHDLTAEMKAAVGYYKTTFLNNLSSYLDRAVKSGTLIEVSKDTYALRDSERNNLEAKLIG